MVPEHTPPSREDEPWRPSLRVQLLGGFRLVYGDATVTAVKTPRLQSLLAYLILHRDAPQPRQHLAFLLWPDSTEAQARTNLRNLVHLLRRALPDADRYLQADAQTLQWLPDSPFYLDVAELERAIGQGEPAVALELYRGELLPSCYDDWILPERERLRALFAGAMEREARRLEEARDYLGAIAYAQRLLHCDPLHERIYRQLMRLHALNEDRAAAIHTYHSCVTILWRELAVEPGAATRRSYEALLRVDPEMTATPLAAALPLVGRQQEWARMLAAWRAAAAGRSHMVLLTGEAGIGKTRLAEELLAWCARQGHRTATARCYSLEGISAYRPVISWLRAQPLPPLDDLWLTEIARLLPEVLAARPDLRQPGPLAEAWQRQRFLEALSRALLADGQPILLLLDDLQWCDPDTLDLLAHLLRYDGPAGLLVVSTLREDELPVQHPLERLLPSLRGSGLLEEIALQPLGEEETRLLAHQAAGHTLEEEVATQLYRETEGNPLFVIETVRAHALARHSAGRGLTAAVPERVQATIEARLAQLSPPARQLLGLAAVIGREFTFEMLCRVSGGDEEAVVRALDELWHRRIVRERDEGGYDFCHDRLRQAAYGTLSAARRQLLHRSVAEALLATAPEQPALLAHHFEQANDWQRAARYHRLAGEAARRVYGCAVALTHLDQALALADRARVDADTRYSILALREEVRGVLGEHDAQALDLEAMADLARAAADPLRLAEVRRSQARLLTYTGRYDEAEAAAREALALAEDAGDAPAQAAALVVLSTGLDLRGEPDRAIPQLRAAIELSAPDADPQQSAACRYALASALYAIREYAEAQAPAQAALALYESLDDLPGQAEALNLLGIIAMEQGDLDEARNCHQHGLELCRTSGFRHGQARALCNLGNILYVQGQLGQTVERYDEAAAIFRVIGHRKGEAVTRMNLAAIRYGVLGQADQAQSDAEAVLAYARSTGDRATEGHGLATLGAVAKLRGDLAEARRQLEAGLAVLEAAGEHWVGMQALITLVYVGLDEGRPEAALIDLERAEALGSEFGIGSLEADLLAARAAVLLALGRPAEAQAVAAEATARVGAGTKQPYLAPFVLYQALLALDRAEEAHPALAQAYQAVLDLVKGLSSEQQHWSLELQPQLRAIVAAWRAGPNPSY